MDLVSKIGVRLIGSVITLLPLKGLFTNFLKLQQVLNIEVSRKIVLHVGYTTYSSECILVDFL